MYAKNATFVLWTYYDTYLCTFYYLLLHKISDLKDDETKLERLVWGVVRSRRNSGSFPFLRLGWATGKMGYGEYPAEYNPKVHGPFDPARYYGKGK